MQYDGMVGANRELEDRIEELEAQLREYENSSSSASDEMALANQAVSEFKVKMMTLLNR